MAMETKIKKVIKVKPNGLANLKVVDYGNDPFIIKKVKESKALLEKNGFPKELSKKDRI
jgi:hypothetical protein